MNNKQFSKDVGSYVSFALRENLPVSLASKESDTATLNSMSFEDSSRFYNDEYAFIQSDKLSEREFASIEILMEKYSMLKKYLPSKSGLDKLEIVSNDYVKVKDDQQPGVEYRAVAVSANQLEIAKFVAKKVEEVHEYYVKGYHQLAKFSYNSLQDFLAKKRLALIGNFESVSEIEESLGMHAVGTNGNPQALRNPVIFVLIEIWLS